jgi:hypothetical protein
MTGPARELIPSQYAPDRLVSARTLIAQCHALLDQVNDIASAVPAPGALTLTRYECNQIEETTGLGTTSSGPELLRAVQRLASIQIGDIRIPFTPGQLAELQHRAHKRGRSVAEEMKAVVARIEDELFYKGG